MKQTAFEERLSNKLKVDYKLRMDLANFATGFIPNYILLDRTRNIHSYMVFCEIKDEKIYSSRWNSNNMKDIILNFLRVQYSSLDRPLFFILQDKNKSIRIIESEIIREKLLNEPNIELNKFMIDESAEMSNLLPIIYKEL